MKKTKHKPVKQRALVGLLGKDLTRRSRGRCELCESREGVRAWEIPPFPEQPDLERALMVCAQCRSWLEGAPVDVVASHFLMGAVWSDLAPVKLAAARLILASGFDDDPDVRDALAHAQIDADTGEFAREVT